jgi:hypothetical protein
VGELNHFLGSQSYLREHVKGDNSRRRKSPKSITLDSHLRCLRIYPTENTRTNINQLKTIGIKLNK